MKLLLILIPLFLVLAANSFSQTTDELANEEIAQDHARLLNQIFTLTLSLDEISKNDQGLLKDEFLGYGEKIISLELNEITEILVLEHNGHFLKIELFSILEKFNITESSVLSYN